MFSLLALGTLVLLHAVRFVLGCAEPSPSLQRSYQSHRVAFLGCLSVDPLPADQAVPSPSLINPSKSSSSDRLEQQNPHEPAEAEPGKGKLCTHKLTCSWGYSDSTAEPTTVALAQLCPGCISLSQTFPRHSSGVQKGHLGANICFLESKDAGAGSWLESILPFSLEILRKIICSSTLACPQHQNQGVPPHSMEVIWSSPLAHLGPRRDGCSGPCPDGF